MDGDSFVDLLKKFKKRTNGLAKKCQGIGGKQVQSAAVLSDLEALATQWFNEIEPTLRSAYSIDEDALLRYREPLGTLLELVGGRPSKNLVQEALGSIAASFHIDILVPVQKCQAALTKYPGLDVVLSHAQGLEVDYLTEAVECARLGKRRAAIILGWCAAINRLHVHVERTGFAKFNQASVQMSAMQSGRYRRFSKKYNIQNLSDLRMTVFDGDLLWVLEFIGAIDGNQHERMEICFTMRNTCAHPGEATFSEENVLSFFSDIDSLVLANEKFAP
jgi:hypothetical protein